MTDGRLNDAALRYRRDGYAFPFDAIGTARASEAAKSVEKLLEQPPADLQHPWRIKMHLLCDWIFDLATDDAVLDGVESVIGPDILLQAADLFCKPPGGTPAHQLAPGRQLLESRALRDLHRMDRPHRCPS